MPATYLIHRNGQQFGPYALESVRHYLAQGLVTPSDYIWTEGMPNWTTVEMLLQTAPPPEALSPPVAPPATLPEAAPSLGTMPSHQEAPPASPAAAIPATPPPQKSGNGVWIGIGIAAAIVLLIAAYLIFGPKPEDSLDQARAAFLQHDQANFDKYVDVQSVLSDWMDQATNGWLQEENASGLERVLAQIAVQSLKNAYLPAMSQWVDQVVATGNATQQPQTEGSDQTGAFVTNFISSTLYTLASSQLSYEGIASKSVSGANAYLNVNVGTPVSDQPVVVTIKMQRVGVHWRVVAVENVAALLQQLGQSPNQ